MKQVRHSEEERRRIIGEWRESGQNSMTFCEARGIPYRSFTRWQREQVSQPAVREAFLPALIKAGPIDGARTCRIRVGEYVIIDCGPETSAAAVETAVRAAVAACGPM